ncbi:MAG: glycosyltransferase [Desulfobacterales bacterium]|nr:glycosyltransferase [Desulfobacterales bacterium]
MNILVICKLGFAGKSSGFSGDARAVYHLSPIAFSKQVDRLYSIRYKRFERPVPNVVEYTHMNWHDNYFLFPVAMLHIFAKALWICRRHQIDYIIGFTIPYGVLAWITARITKRNVVISFIGADLYTCVREKWYGKIVVHMLRHCDHVTVTGAEMREILIARGAPADRIHILPHGIDTSAFQCDKHNKKYDMVFVGELVYRKRVDTLLDALGFVKQTLGHARFCIVGDGPLREELEHRAKRLRIAGAVDFVGFQEDVRPYLQQSKVFVLASQGEGLPFAMIEAMACGLVPVVTDVGTIGDVVRDGENGFLVGVGESQAIAKCVVTLLADQQLYGKMSREAAGVREKFSYEKATQVWDAIFVL